MVFSCQVANIIKVMSEKGENSAEDQSLEAIRAEAKSLLSDIKKFKTQAEEYLRATENARQKADSEALFAFNAKGACEGHSTAIANLKGTVEADVNSIATNKQKVDELVPFVTTNKSFIETDIKIIGDSRKEVEQAATGIKDAAEKGSSRLQEIETSKSSSNTLLAEIEGSRDAAINACKKVETAQAQADGFVGEITTAHKTSIDLSDQIKTLLANVTAQKAALDKIVEHLTKSDEIAIGYEIQVSQLTKEVEALKKRVEDLLPGATSAGLASAFCTQKNRFTAPQWCWLTTFVLCILALLSISLPSFWNATFGATAHAMLTWDETLHGLAIRLPIVIPLVWLAIYAGRHYMLAARLAEEYAYKEAVSTAFEGYKREMLNIVAEDAAHPTPITKLCVNVLTAIAERPGRIYEGKHQDITIQNELKEALEKAAEFSKKQISAK